jgi:hypothetical protein
VGGEKLTREVFITFWGKNNGRSQYYSSSSCESIQYAGFGDI